VKGAIITFDGISKSFGTHKVIRNLSLSIHGHEIFGIVGRSGSGKSTLLKMLVGFYPVDSGKILFHGKDITNNSGIIKRVVGLCTQENSFYPELTVQENLWYYGRLYGLSRKMLKERQKELLQLVGIYGSRLILAGNLSGGMKRRLDFAISLLHKPELLILDEPTTGLDPIIERQIWDLIHDLSRRGVSVIVISHMLSFVERYCDTVGFLDKGSIVLQSSPKALRKKYSKDQTFAEIFEKILVKK
jgi:ABC-type multidrug transport system ATPase subunit